MITDNNRTTDTYSLPLHPLNDESQRAASLLRGLLPTTTYLSRTSFYIIKPTNYFTN